MGAAMENRPLSIGSLHARDFAPLRTQRILADLSPDGQGQVRFGCLSCERTGAVPLAILRVRFAPTEGLVNILNALLPADCRRAARDASGHVGCGFCYGDPKGRPDD
jgi:hypothetical protein